MPPRWVSPAVVSPTQLGATSEHGTDYYIAATKVFLAAEPGRERRSARDEGE